MDEKFLKVYYDAEFTGLHKGTTLISIGMVSESGSRFYAEFDDYDKTQVDAWLKENVIDHLVMKDAEVIVSQHGGNDSPNYNELMQGNTDKVRKELMKWLKNESDVAGKQIRFYTDCYAYDWMLLNDLICDFGVALNTPDYINYIPIDLSTMLLVMGVDPDITREDMLAPQQHDAITRAVFPMDFALKNQDGYKHNSLWDAYVAKMCFEKLIKVIDRPVPVLLSPRPNEDNTISFRDNR